MATMRVSLARHGANPLRSTSGKGNFTLRPGIAQPSKWHQQRSLNTSTSSGPSVKDPVIFSGIQPTGVPHLGNYLGALRQWVKLQDEASSGTKLLFSIVDLHALTVPQDAKQLRAWRREAFATLLAVGLDPKRSTIFYQSSVSSRNS
jgi:tryptophanyl-tRNA synthetase